MTSNHYLAIIGDLVDSKKIIGEQRRQVQSRLEETLDSVNELYREFIVSDFLITLGDEFQGLLRPNAPLYEIISCVVEGINAESYKEKFVEVRFGIGLGRILTDIKRVALGMDGPAFHYARKALDISHNSKGHAIVFRAEPSTIIEQDETTINALLGLLAVSRKFWIHKTSRFNEILPYLRENKNQRDIASALNCTQPLVSKLVASAYWSEIKELESTVDALIKTSLDTPKARGNRKKNSYASPV